MYRACKSSHTWLKKMLPTVKQDEWWILTQNRFWPLISITIKAQKGCYFSLIFKGNWLISYNNTNFGKAFGGIRTLPSSSFPHTLPLFLSFTAGSGCWTAWLWSLEDLKFKSCFHDSTKTSSLTGNCVLFSFLCFGWRDITCFSAKIVP